MEYLELNDGFKMPKIGLGTFQGDYDFSACDETVIKSVKSAFEVGYRHIDTARKYSTEVPVGKAVNELINSKAVSRDDVFITKKLWGNKMAKRDVVPTLKESLANLGLDYVDMYLIHWPTARKSGDDMMPADENGKLLFEDIPLTETWEGMIECQKLGLARSIGVSNFNRRQMQLLFDHSSVRPSNQQIEVHPYFSNDKIIKFCQQNGVQISAFSPLCQSNRPWALPDEPKVATDPVLTEIGAKYGKTPSQVALRFLTQRNLAAVPKCNSRDHQRENITIFDFELSPEEMKDIFTKCDRNLRVLGQREAFGGSKEWPFDDEY